ncbi:MAG TPA: rifamycin-inactivating phosphotransferase [Opitutaceae bacterium]|nr:rifamycin-inactivating phosphotransferase [Opitutaceae bacterium]
MDRYVLGFHSIDRTQVATAGGKGAQLGELSRIEGVQVPPGFCVSTAVFRKVAEESAAIRSGIDRLSRLTADDADAARNLAAEIRRCFEEAAIFQDAAQAVSKALNEFGESEAYAVRSSATAEDMPTASFAGQQDTFLNVVGATTILEHVRRCWASLFTDRAVAYRQRNGIDHRKVQMAVIVQRMVFPSAAGVLFTADPMTGNRKIASVEACFGLGEALVSGLVNADVYKVRDGSLLSKLIGRKEVAIESVSSGGTRKQALSSHRQTDPALTDSEVLRLAEVGRRIEAHFGRPQDIEWCLSNDGFQIVQSRPITTLFPIPEAADKENHVYVSVGHQQMMTDPIKPLGLSIWQMTTRRRMAEAAGRLFVDVTQILASPVSRGALLETLGRSDPLIRDALQTIAERENFLPAVSENAPRWTPPGSGAAKPLETDPAIVAELIAQTQAGIAATKRAIQTKSGTTLFDFIQADMRDVKEVQFDPRSLQAVMAGMEAAWWLNDHVRIWLGEKNVADVLAQSVPGNVTSEMGLALLDVADVIRPHAEVVALLQQVENEDFLDELPRFAGGEEARAAICDWLDKYGMRCVGEIDITRPRWGENPSALLPLLLGNVRNFPPGEAQRRFAKGAREAQEKEKELLERLRSLPDGAQKAEETKSKIDRLRIFSGYREYPKYGMISRYFVYKQALLKEAERLVKKGILQKKEDIFYLSFEEFREVVCTEKLDQRLIRQREETYQSYRSLTPPRVLTSEGEAMNGSYRRSDLPAGALVGLGVSAGTIEGRARVVLDMAEANLEPGEILVTTYTDPSWTPLFVAASALVTEVGGLMTHGAVIAREYGLPAVVGVEGATRRIKGGDRLRVHGTEGYVEILPA